MYFYVDESGQTGNNLFDKNQPFLYYGVLSSKYNLDVLAEPDINRLRQSLGVSRLHAQELGVNGLDKIGRELVTFRKKFDLRFSLSRVNKIDHALICFFDQVFDQGNNPAVPWSAYWTPIRYVYLLYFEKIFDRDLLQKAWEARISTDAAQSEIIVAAICKELIQRISLLGDERIKNVFYDVFTWAKENAKKLSYNAIDKHDRKSISPNIIGFQQVLQFISERVRKLQLKKISVVVDQQSEFNQAQQTLADYYAAAKGSVFELGPGLPKMDLRGMPTKKLIFSSSQGSAGLELVDIYLWTFKRKMEEKPVPEQLSSLILDQVHRGSFREISMLNIKKLATDFINELPQFMSESEMERGKELFRIQEEHRANAMDK